jgi:DNA processing protein
VWRARAEADPEALLAAHRAAGVQVLLLDDPAYPEAIRADHEPPAVLFAHGDLARLDGPRVAVVGTRRCTGSGAVVARELGHDLAAAGVGVVSGLALGIDGATHTGALLAGEVAAGSPIGVIGCGHDRPYPRRNAALWAAVGDRGVLLGECPLGTPPASWRFPARNRVIATLADVLVVVESHAVGGSLLTVQEAIDRDVPVMAVPGSVRSPATAGTNQLLADGCHPVRDVDDVLVALGLHSRGRAQPADRRRRPGPDGADVLAALGWEPSTLEQLVVRTGRPVLEVSLALHELEQHGWVALDGPWYEQLAAG